MVSSTRVTKERYDPNDTASPFGSSVYTPGLHQVMNDFNVPRIIALLPFVLYLLGLSFGPIVAGPSSETWGRRAVYISTIPCVAAFTLGAGFSPNITALSICRFFAGLFASPGLSIGAPSFADIWPPEKRGAPIAMMITLVQLGPAVGPVVGGAVTIHKSWRWTQWTILFGLVVVFIMTITQSETYKSVILRRRARKLGLSTGNSNDKSTRSDRAKLFLTKTVLRPLHMMTTEPIVAAFDIYVAFNFGLLNAFFAAFAWVFETQYHFSLTSTGLTYLGQAAGSLVGLSIMLYIYRFYWTRETVKAKPGKMAPEKRLIIAKLASPMMPTALFWFAWTARPEIHWISPVIAEAFFACGNLLIFTCTSLYFTDCYGAAFSASAWSSSTFLRYLAAFAFPLFVLQMYEALGVGWATSLLGFVSAVLMPIPFLQGRWGPRLRGRSSYSSGE